MKKFSVGALAVSTTLLSPLAAHAQTEVQFWHAFTGRLGELVAAQVEDFNASQDNYTVVQSHKGNYSETLNAGIAAFRAGEQPQILMVFEVGTATMMAASGATRPVHEVMAASGAAFGWPIPPLMPPCMKYPLFGTLFS
jgi:sn-glycerol 3-phosphate transport system substrate-binding protein